MRVIRRLGFDLDDVIANSGPLFFKLFSETTGLPLVNEKEPYLEKAFNVPVSFVRSWMEKYAQEVYSQCKPLDLCVDVLNRLSYSNIIEIISSRYPEDGYVTLQWINTHKIPCDHLFLVGGDQNKIEFLRKRELNLYVDDKIEILNSIRDKNCVLILFGKSSNDERILSVSNWEDLEKCINKVFSSSLKV